MEKQQTKKIIIGVDWDRKILDYKGYSYDMEDALRKSRKMNSNNSNIKNVRIIDTEETG